MARTRKPRLLTAVELHKRTTRTDIMHSRVHGVESARTKRRKASQSHRMGMREL